ncbi:Polynucleotidyl transferase, ribonuclease H-like superfamily protein [Parasponia andersonii]|uniref:Polynucleotidyl transferase, ribonuclease H-like superfamily protein n=1 Tax=Parasponia andersonii TaxID=3476 RepID=A0A2P5A3Y5_PARAD|nr:Polynucleotidyl transferase, ribonuclease H-like superfamily protein [Parasponia andersonii]
MSRENLLHLFKDCTLARMLWYGSKWVIRVDQFSGGEIAKDFFLWLLNQVQPSDKDDFICLTTCICDTIWKARNNSIFRNGKADPDRLRIESHNAYVGMCQRREKGFVKINTDAPLVVGNCGTAAILRDEEGSVLLLSFKSDYANSPLKVECETILLALNIALENGWNKVIIESGASLVVQSLRSGKRPPEWESFALFSSIVVNLCCSFQSISFDFTPRQVNVRYGS